MTRAPELELIDPDLGDHMTWEDFVGRCRRRSFVDYDGFGELATATHVSTITISPSRALTFAPPAWATHVVWYNR